MPSVAVNFQFGRFIDRAKGASRHQLIAAMVALNLLVLIVFKYSDFIVANINFLLDKVDLLQVPQPHLTLPLGLSFFTFHIISYLVDVYRGNQPDRQLSATDRWSDYSLFTDRRPTRQTKGDAR